MYEDLLEDILPDINKISEEVNKIENIEKSVNCKKKPQTKKNKQLLKKLETQEIETLPDDIIKMKDILLKITMGGQSEFYLGKKYLVSEINTLTNVIEIAKLYSLYESKLGLIMTKTLGETIINTAVGGLQHIIPLKNVDKLKIELKNDPFVDMALRLLCSQAYYSLGVYMAPLTVALKTLQHYDHAPKLNVTEPEQNVTEPEQNVTDSQQNV